MSNIYCETFLATASYRLHPYIELKEEIEGPLAEKLQSCFSPGVMGIKVIKGKRIAFVENDRLDMCSRNCYRYDDLKDKVIIGRKTDHFIFTIESCVGLGPEELFKESVKALKKKCIDSLVKLKELLK